MKLCVSSYIKNGYVHIPLLKIKYVYILILETSNMQKYLTVYEIQIWEYLLLGVDKTHPIIILYLCAYNSMSYHLVSTIVYIVVSSWISLHECACGTLVLPKMLTCNILNYLTRSRCGVWTRWLPKWKQ
jgi:hypothetical protein